MNDKYPAYITWETYEQIRDMLSNNLAEYDRNRRVGSPDPVQPCCTASSIVVSADTNGGAV